MKEQKQVNLIEKTYIKHVNVTLYVFASSRDASVKYYITTKNGVIDPATHMDCDGFYYRGHCAHTNYIAQEQSPLATYDVQAAATQVLVDAEIGDAYEHMPKVLATYTFSDHCRHCGGNHNSNECPY